MNSHCRACEARLDAGRYYGDVARRFESCNATISTVVHPHGRALPRHEHELAYFCMLLDGSYAESDGAREIRYEPFDAGFHPSKTAHTDVVGTDGGRFLCLEVKPFADDEVRLRRGIELLSGHVSVLLARTQHAFARGTLTTIALESTAWELCGEASEGRAPRERTAPRWLTRALERIECDHASPLTVASIACEAGVHPVHASREFRRRFARTIGDYVNDVRIRTACAAIARDPDTLAEVAMRAGFADQPHFCRVFRSKIGCTPSQFAAGRRR